MTNAARHRDQLLAQLASALDVPHTSPTSHGTGTSYGTGPGHHPDRRHCAPGTRHHTGHGHGHSLGHRHGTARSYGWGSATGDGLGDGTNAPPSPSRGWAVDGILYDTGDTW